MKNTIALMFAILIIMLSAVAFRAECAIKIAEEVHDEKTVIVTNVLEEGNIINILVFPGKEGSSNKVIIKNDADQIIDTLYMKKEGRCYKNEKQVYKTNKKGIYSFEVHDYFSNKEVKSEIEL